MRITTFLFLCFQAVDFITTTIAIEMGMQELNPIQHIYGWKVFITFKVVSAIIIALILQFKKRRSFDILVPGILAVLMIFNALQLVLAW